MNRTLAVALAAATSLTRPAHACETQQTGNLDTIVTNWLNAHKSLATGLCAVALDSKGHEGFACVGKSGGKEVLDKDTLFQIGSVTKTFTGTMLAIRIAQAEYALADSIESHLPAAFRAGSKDKLTIEQLVTHHAGLPRDPPHFAGEAADLGDFQVYCATQGHCVGPYGDAYSNWGFQVLGYTIAIEDGFSYMDDLYYSTLLLLGMGDTKTREGWKAADEAYFQQHAAARHDELGNSLGIGPVSKCPTADPSGCLYSSPHDMRVWLQYQMGLVTPPGSYAAARHELRQYYRQNDDITSTLQGLGWGFVIAEDDTACDVLPKPYKRSTFTQYHYTRVDKMGDIESGSHSIMYFLQDPNDPDGVSPLGVVIMANSDIMGGPSDLKAAGRELLETLPLP